MIDQWLYKFNDSWKNHDIGSIVSLFDENVIYWETPFKRLHSLFALKNEWAVIKNQFDIQLTTSVYSEQNSRYTIKWTLFYTNESHQRKHWSGIYLIELNEQGKCTYFYQVGEYKLGENDA